MFPGLEDNGNRSIKRLSLEAVVPRHSIPKDGRELGERVADLDGIHVSCVDAGNCDRGVAGKVDKSGGADDSVHDAWSSAHHT